MDCLPGMKSRATEKSLALDFNSSNAEAQKTVLSGILNANFPKRPKPENS